MNLEKLSVNTQSSIRIQGEKTIYFDPLEITGTPHDADVIFITHDHYDHFSPEDIQKLAKEETLLVVPVQMEQEARKKTGLAAVLAVRPHGSYEISGLHVETLPAYNKLKPFHPKRKEWCGYLVEMEGERFYVAGDTDCLEENAAIRCSVAFVPVGGTYTMDVSQAAKLVNQIHPQLAVPTHYGSIVGDPSDGKRFREKVNPEIEVRILLA